MGNVLEEADNAHFCKTSKSRISTANGKEWNSSDRQTRELSETVLPTKAKRNASVMINAVTTHGLRKVGFVPLHLPPINATLFVSYSHHDDRFAHACCSLGVFVSSR